MTRRSWFGAIFAVAFYAFLVLHADGIASALVPHSWWIDVHAVQVRSVTDGTSPRVIIDREVNRDISGMQVATELYPISGGGYRVCPRVKNLRPMEKGSVFGVDQNHNPKQTLLEQIQDVPPNPPCTFEDGDYRVDFTWRVKNLFWWLPGVTLSYTVQSNIFNWQDGKP